MSVPSGDTRYALGFDPGGEGAFGWAVVAETDSGIRMVACGICSDANRAIELARHQLPAVPHAIGADSAQFWVVKGDRQADLAVRKLLVSAGGNPSTVQHVNSLRGACLVQGALVMRLAHKLWPHAVLNEAHPKALLPVCRAAAQFVRESESSWKSEHERDAALAAFAALAAARRDPAWQDLRILETGVWFPVDLDVRYWFPKTVD